MSGRTQQTAGWGIAGWAETSAAASGLAAHAAHTPAAVVAGAWPQLQQAEPALAVARRIRLRRAGLGLGSVAAGWLSLGGLGGL